MVTNGDKKSQKVVQKFYCSKCDYICSRQYDFSKHQMTRKHTYGDKMVTNGDKKSQKVAEYICECGNVYKHRQGLSRHKKHCNEYNHTSYNMDLVENTHKTGFDIDKELLVKMLLKNNDVMEKMVEMMPNLGNNSHNTNSNNTTNNQFNIQMFLNDHCKNAMNLTDFIQSLPITSETYDNTIENGLTKTITNMLVNGLNELDILQRPIHCTDASRKILYVKDADKWEKDNELLHIVKGIRDLSLKQRTLISKWKNANKGWDTDDNLQSKMTSLVFNSMTQIENDEKETNKIIRTISKSVYLDNDIKGEYKPV